MKKRNRWRLAAIACAVCATLVGCATIHSGTASAETGSNNARSAVTGEYLDGTTDQAYAMKSEQVSEEEISQEIETVEAPSKEPEQQAQGTEDLKAMDSRKLIRNMDLTIETKEFDQILINMEQKITQLGGYVEMLNTNTNGYYGDNLYGRTATIVARIPTDVAKDFVEHVGQNSNIISRGENVQDVTLEYVDLASRKKVLSIEMERLVLLLEKAEKLEDIFAIEGRITEVRYELDGMESRLRNYDNLVEYSTVTLYIQEVATITAPQEADTWEKITLGFEKNVVAMKQGCINFFAGVLIYSPFILLWVVIIGLAMVVMRLIYKRVSKKRKEKSNQDRGAATVKEEINKTVVESQDLEKTPDKKEE